MTADNTASDAATPKQQKAKASSTTLVELASYPLALVSGYTVFETSVRKVCYKNLASQGLFDDMQKARKQ